MKFNQILFYCTCSGPYMPQDVIQNFFILYQTPFLLNRLTSFLETFTTSNDLYWQTNVSLCSLCDKCKLVQLSLRYLSLDILPDCADIDNLNIYKVTTVQLAYILYNMSPAPYCTLLCIIYHIYWLEFTHQSKLANPILRLWLCLSELHLLLLISQS